PERPGLAAARPRAVRAVPFCLFHQHYGGVHARSLARRANSNRRRAPAPSSVAPPNGIACRDVPPESRLPGVLSRAGKRGVTKNSVIESSGHRAIETRNPKPGKSKLEIRNPSAKPVWRFYS